MAQCKAFGCLNNKRTHKTKKFFCVPKPITEEKKVLAKKWLHNLGTGHILKTFTFSRNSVVCEDHFDPDCYERNMQAEIMGYQGRTRLKPDAVPTIFVHRKAAASDKGRNVRVANRDKQKYLHELSKASAASSVAPAQSPPSSSDCDSEEPVQLGQPDPVYPANWPSSEGNFLWIYSTQHEGSGLLTCLPKSWPRWMYLVNVR
ncbi:THAP domain-containing protein 1-like [Pseudoliparis swirei]|uniref:THAP domain-containing protein 1-like n=1 Tax=Pseudoliparis swirei TaxID=2059687 RepID=UPI0024BE8EA4|nr:THAP domain-containing protein 1-like [Pseudoliparis swirei]